MLKEIIIAAQSYFKAHEFINKYKLWKWIIVPGIIYAVLFVISMYYFGKTSNNFIEWLSLKTGLKNWLDRMQNGLLSFLFTLAALILWLIQMMLYFSLFKYIWLIAGSPIFSYISEKTNAILLKKQYPFKYNQLITDSGRGVKIAVRNALWQTFYMVTIMLISLIPIIGWATPVLALFVECYYYGFSMLDYSCGRKKINAAQSIFFIGRHRGLAIGNGLAFYLMHLFPIVGWVLAPSYAIIAATLSMHETLNNKTNAQYLVGQPN